MWTLDIPWIIFTVEQQWPWFEECYSLTTVLGFILSGVRCERGLDWSFLWWSLGFHSSIGAHFPFSIWNGMNNETLQNDFLCSKRAPNFHLSYVFYDHITLLFRVFPCKCGTVGLIPTKVFKAIEKCKGNVVMSAIGLSPWTTFSTRKIWCVEPAIVHSFPLASVYSLVN